MKRIGWWLVVTAALSVSGGVWAQEAEGRCGDMEWYLRVGVQTPEGDMVDRNAVVGWLYDAADGQDRYDLEELPPFTTPYLTLVFPHPEYDPAGDYANEYHDTCLSGGWNAVDEWVFQIKSDDPKRRLVLWWEPVQWVERAEVVQPPGGPTVEILRRLMPRFLRLQDVDTGRWIAMDAYRNPQGRYAFEMGGDQVKTFRLVFMGGLYARPWGRFGGGRRGIAGMGGDATEVRSVAASQEARIDAVLAQLPPVKVAERPIAISEEGVGLLPPGR